MQNDEVSAEKVAAYYDAWTSRYQASFGDTFQACRPTETSDLHRYLMENSGMQPGERVLDAGCGVCGPSIYFASNGGVTIHAVTVSATQVAAARQAIEAAGLGGRITVHHGDFHKLHELFPASTFDRVLFLESLSHAADPAGPLHSVFQVLKPGGTVYIKDFFAKRHGDEATQRHVDEVTARIDEAFAVKTPSIDYTVSALQQIGFTEQYRGEVAFENDTAVWVRFNQAHQFNLWGNRPSVEWCDWIELRFQKPFEAVAAD